MKFILLASGLICSMPLFCQTFYFGNDLSYVNMMEDCGAVFKEGGVPKDVYQIVRIYFEKLNVVEYHKLLIFR